MIDSKFHAVIQPVISFLAKGLVRLRIKANTVTLGGFLFGILSAVFIALQKPYLALILLWVSGLLDVLDGSVARLTGTSSSRGAYLDLILDRMVEAGVILGFTAAFPQFYLAYILFLVSVLFNFTTFIVAGALFTNTGSKSMHFDPGIAERTETFLVFSIMMLLPKSIFIVLLVFSGIIFITGIIRFVKIMGSAGKD